MGKEGRALSKIKVLLVDDHTLLRQGLRKLLELEPSLEVVGEGGNGKEALEKAKDLQPDVILLDINMPGMNGVEATSLLKQTQPELKIIILTIHKDDEYIFEAIKAGASGYILKDVETKELIKAIQTAAAGESIIDPALASRLFQEFSRLSHKGPREALIQTLTEREKEILSLLVQGFSNRDLAQALFISEKTVKNHISNIFRKMEVSDRTQAVVKALKMGLVKLG